MLYPKYVMVTSKKTNRFATPRLLNEQKNEQILRVSKRVVKFSKLGLKLKF